MIVFLLCIDQPRQEQEVMPRRGWTPADSAGWVQILRGPRPPAPMWPTRTKPQPVAATPTQGRWKRTNGGDRSPAKVRSLEAALAALGPEDCATKNELETALKRAKEQPSLQVRTDPDTKIAAARERVSRLEKAITALGDFDGVEVENLKAALKRAQKEAQEVPVVAQIREREAFIERAKKRIARIDEERQAEVRSLEEAENKLNQLRALRIPQQEQPISSVPDSSAEVQRLQAIVSQLQRQLEQSATRANPVRPRLREDFVPNSVEEMQQWMFDRQQDLQEATMAVRPGEVSRISQLMAQGAQEWNAVNTDVTTTGPGMNMLPSTVGLLVR